MCIVGEAKSPNALRHASDLFFEWVKPEVAAAVETAFERSSPITNASKIDPTKLESPKPVVKRRPKFVVEAVSLRAGDTSEGKVGLGPLGAYLKRTDPAFSPQAFRLAI